MPAPDKNSDEKLAELGIVRIDGVLILEEAWELIQKHVGSGLAGEVTEIIDSDAVAKTFLHRAADIAESKHHGVVAPGDVLRAIAK